MLTPLKSSASFCVITVMASPIRGRENGRPSTHLAPRFTTGLWVYQGMIFLNLADTWPTAHK